MMSTSTDALIAILLMALVSFAIKAGGLLLADRLPQHGFAATWLGYIPPAVMAALVAPAIANGGPAEWIAAVTTTLAYMATRTLFVAMGVGILTVYFARQVTGLG